LTPVATLSVANISSSQRLAASALRNMLDLAAAARKALIGRIVTFELAESRRNGY
jgi:hypothetical protein